MIRLKCEILKFLQKIILLLPSLFLFVYVWILFMHQENISNTENNVHNVTHLWYFEFLDFHLASFTCRLSRSPGINAFIGQ